jgi:hypothetical protein
MTCFPVPHGVVSCGPGKSGFVGKDTKEDSGLQKFRPSPDRKTRNRMDWAEKQHTPNRPANIQNRLWHEVPRNATTHHCDE